jgi:hypothetical protein
MELLSFIGGCLKEQSPSLLVTLSPLSPSPLGFGEGEGEEIIREASPL